MSLNKYHHAHFLGAYIFMQNTDQKRAKLALNIADKGCYGQFWYPGALRLSRACTHVGSVVDAECLQHPGQAQAD